MERYSSLQIHHSEVPAIVPQISKVVGKQLWSRRDIATIVRPRRNYGVTALTLFGLFAVTAMLVTYAMESRSPWFILAFAASCALGSVYGFLQGAWPFGVVEAIWSIVALRRWCRARK
jgi:hypothetical protein